MIKKLALTLFLVIILLVALAGAFVHVWQLFVFAAVILFLSWLWSQLASRRISARVSVETESRNPGETLGEDFVVENGGRLPVPDPPSAPGVRRVSEQGGPF